MNFEELSKFITNKTHSFHYTIDLNRSLDFGINEYKEKNSNYEIPATKSRTKRKVSVTEKYTILHVAIEEGNKAAVEWLLENGADPNLEKVITEIQSYYGRYTGFKPESDEITSILPIDLAMDNDTYDIAKLLYARGAVVDPKFLSSDQKQKLGIEAPKAKLALKKT